jgi:hypothetical protein
MTQVDTHPVMRRLHNVSPTAVFLITLGAILISLLFLGFFGALLLLVLGAAMAALLAVTWRRHDRRGRLIRLGMIGLLVVLSLIRMAA